MINVIPQDVLQYTVLCAPESGRSLGYEVGLIRPWSAGRLRPIRTLQEELRSCSINYSGPSTENKTDQIPWRQQQQQESFGGHPSPAKHWATVFFFFPCYRLVIYRLSGLFHSRSQFSDAKEQFEKYTECTKYSGHLIFVWSAQARWSRVKAIILMISLGKFIPVTKEAIQRGRWVRAGFLNSETIYICKAAAT